MQKVVTKADIQLFLEELDARVIDFTPSKLDRTIASGFAELCTVLKPFSKQHIVDLAPYYAAQELKFEIVAPDDVIDLYDCYLGKDTGDTQTYKQGIIRNRVPSVISKHPQILGVVDVDLNATAETYEYATISYFYQPDANFDEIFISGDVYLSFENAMAMAAYDTLHDIERAGQKRAAFNRTTYGVSNLYPPDHSEPRKKSMFPDGC